MNCSAYSNQGRRNRCARNIGAATGAPWAKTPQDSCTQPHEMRQTVVPRSITGQQQRHRCACTAEVTEANACLLQSSKLLLPLSRNTRAKQISIYTMENQRILHTPLPFALIGDSLKQTQQTAVWSQPAGPHSHTRCNHTCQAGLVKPGQTPEASWSNSLPVKHWSRPVKHQGGTPSTDATAFAHIVVVRIGPRNHADTRRIPQALKPGRHRMQCYGFHKLGGHKHAGYITPCMHSLLRTPHNTNISRHASSTGMRTSSMLLSACKCVARWNSSRSTV
jgi:hypothetical protein